MSLCGCVSVSHWLHITMVTMVSGETGPSQGMVVSGGEREEVWLKNYFNFKTTSCSFYGDASATLIKVLSHRNEV